MTNSTPNNHGPLLTIRDLSCWLNATEDAVRARIRRGRIPGIIKDGHTYRADPNIIEAWLESKRLNTPADEALRGADTQPREPGRKATYRDPANSGEGA